MIHATRETIARRSIGRFGGDPSTPEADHEGRAGRFLAPLLLFLLAGCASATSRHDARTTVMSFPDLDCADCGETMARALIDEDGVYKTAFDKRRVELSVVADPRIDALALARAKKPADERWHLVLGAGLGRYVPWRAPPDHADVSVIAEDGADVPDLAAHLVPGKVTIVDFSAKWCAPCRALDEHVVRIVSLRSDVAYRKVDVGDWDSPVGTHYLGGVKELPFVMFFDKKGRKVDTMTGLDLERFDRTLDRAAERP